MIYYFSGTGNSKWVAENLASELSDIPVSISEWDKSELTFNKEDTVGLVFPIYAWDAPEIIKKFAKAIKLNGAFAFAVCTCGENCGNAIGKLSKVLAVKAGYSIVMPNNYIVGMSVDSDETAKRKISDSKSSVKLIADKVKAREEEFDIEKGRFAFLKSSVASLGFNKFARTTKPFKSNEKCNGCGLCEKNCPVAAIKISEGKPVWGNECYQCLSCINRCPKEAIEYGTMSENKGRYYIEKYL